MKGREYIQAAQLFKVLAHPVRLQLLEMLLHGEECICHMQAALHRPQPYISQQMAILRDAGLVQDRKDGLNVFYSLRDKKVATVLQDILRREQGERGPSPRMPVEGCPCPKCRAG